MIKQSLRQYLVDYVMSIYPNWAHKGELEKMVINQLHYEGDNAARRCRELVNKGIFEKKIVDGCVLYRYCGKELVDTIMNQAIDQQKLKCQPMFKQESFKI
jgi:hypothetical protein